MTKITRRWNDQGELIPLTIISHDKCSDGFAAAWQIKEDCDDVIFTSYGLAPPDVRGKSVVIVDFSYPREVMCTLAAEAETLLVLDHHKGAMEALEGLAYAEFDMARSGAMMAYEWMEREAEAAGVAHPRSHGYKLVSYVQDRDLWTHSLPDTREVSAYIRTLGQDFGRWDRAALDLTADPGRVVGIGEGCLATRDQLVQSETERARWCWIKPVWYQRERKIAGVIANGSPALSSDTCAALLAKYSTAEFACVWHQDSLGVHGFSVRSRPGSNTALHVAKLFGGGGHGAAAGFRSPRWPKKIVTR